jgi:hypothetical protein
LDRVNPKPAVPAVLRIGVIYADAGRAVKKTSGVIVM